MIKIFTGEDRVRAKKDISKFLGEDYEVLDGQDISIESLPNIFLGASLFASIRSILIRDLSVNKPVFDKLPDYLDSPHKVALFETKLDKRSTTYKTLKSKIEIKEYPLAQDPNLRKVFNIFQTAKTNGQKAISILEEIKQDQDPMMFFGLLVSQALKDYNQRQGIKEKRVLRELSKLDILLKTTQTSPWLLIESFLLRLASLR